MNTAAFCQSCGMPLDDDKLFGSYADQSPNKEYCKYCYKSGAFSRPDWDLDDMRTHITRKMESAGIAQEIIESVLAQLPELRRWKIKTPDILQQKSR